MPLSAISHDPRKTSVSVSPVFVGHRIVDLETKLLCIDFSVRHIGRQTEQAASRFCVLILTEDTTTSPVERIDDLCRANVNLAAFVNDKRQCDGNRDREDLRDLPVGVIRCYLRFP